MDLDQLWQDTINEPHNCADCDRPLQVIQRGAGNHPVCGKYTFRIFRRCPCKPKKTEVKNNGG